MMLWECASVRVVSYVRCHNKSRQAGAQNLAEWQWNPGRMIPCSILDRIFNFRLAEQFDIAAV